MLQFVANTPKIPIPFNRLLKIVALVDENHRDVRQLLDLLVGGAFRGRGQPTTTIATLPRMPTSARTSSTSTDRSATRRASSGLAVRRIGFRTPLWALADSRKISDVIASGAIGEVDGFIYLGQQTPAFYAKQIVASICRLRHEPAAALLRRHDGL